MPASAATIEQLARDTLQVADPENALRALSALRQELDNIEPELVQRAIRAGHSWSQVARAIGVSKQAAHRKYRHVAGSELDLGAQQHKMLVTSEARSSVELAREEARALGHANLGTEHLLLGIMRCEKSHATRALRALGATHDTVREMLRTTVPGIGPAAGDSAQQGVSPHARRILEGSLRESLKRGDGYIGVEHLLLALLTDSRNGAVQTLEAMNITPRQIRQQLEREWASVVDAAPAAEAVPDASAAGTPAPAGSFA